MRNLTTIIIAILALSFSSVQAANRYWVASSPSNFNNTSNWSTSSGGSGGASVPTVGDYVYFNGSGAGNCTFDVAVTIDGIRTSGYTGQIDLNGFAFNPTASNTASCRFENGTIIDSPGSSNVSFNTSGTVTFSGTTFNTPINGVAGRVQFNGGIFNSPVVVEDNGGSSVNGNGGCTFNSTFQVTNSGTSYFLMGLSNPDIFNGDVVLLNTSSSRIRMAFNAAGNQFNGNITIGSTNGTGVWFGENGGTASLANTKTITIAGSGFTTGDVRFKGFTQLGNTAQNFTLTGVASAKFENGTTFNGNLVATAPRINLNGATFMGTTIFTKTGSSDNNSSGGNIFTGNAIIINAGTGSLRLGTSAADQFSANLTIANTGTSSLYLAYGSAGNTVAGNLVINNSGTGTSANIIVADGSASSLTVTGTTMATNNSTATTTNRIYLGNQGDITFNNDLTIVNNAATQNSEVFCNYNANSANTYNGNISVSSTHASSDGIRFGQNNGSAILAATKTISVGGSGFIGGRLHFRNFTQVGSTAQTITLTGSSSLYNYDANWGGNVTFKATEFYTKGTTYNGITYLEKTGSGNNYSDGGNTFNASTQLVNSGTNYFLMGNVLADTFNGNVNLTNSSSSNIYLAHNSIGNTITGTLTVTNNGSGSNSHTYIATGTGSSLQINGNTTLNNTSAATNGHIYFGDNGDIILNGNLTASNTPSGNSGYITIANNSNSSLTVTGNTSVTNSGAGTTKRVYLGNNGDIIFNGTVSIANNATASNSEVYVNNGSASVNQFKNNITISSTTALTDGVRFGEGSGSATLAAGKTISIGAGGFIAGTLRFKNFTQTGSTAQNLTLTGTGYLINQDSDWGGNVDFRAPRNFTDGTTFNGTAFLEKTGTTSDASPGGNTFAGNTELKNSGSGYFLMGNGTADSFGGNLTLTNTGTHHIYVAHNAAGNTIAGDLTVNNISSGSTSNIYISKELASTLNVTGNTVINNNSSATNSTIYVGDKGDITFNGNLSLSNTSTGSNGQIFFANNSNSAISVAGNTTIINTGSGSTKRTYVGNSGDITFNGTLDIVNSASTSNSEVYCNHYTSSANVYNGNITIAVTHASNDGIRFGESNGSSTLANGKTISLSAGGFISGVLRFRNFTQVGTTAQSIILTGTGYMLQQDANWGGNVTFKAPRFYTTGTTYGGTSTIEKTGGIGDDASAGGNTFVGNATLTNSGSKYLMFGNGSADVFQADVDLVNSGSSHFYFARSGAGHSVAGNLTATHTPSGTSSYTMLIGDNSTVTLNIGGNVTINTNGTGNKLYTYLGERADITIGGNLAITNAGSGHTSNFIVGNRSQSSITVGGSTTVLNSNTASAYSQVFLGNNGDITFNNSLDITNNSGASNSGVYANHDDNSSNNYNGNITVSSTHTACDGIRFGESGGNGTLANGRSITIPGVDVVNFKGGELRFRNFTQVGNTPHAFELAATATYIYNRNSSWGGNVTFISPRVYVRESTFAGTAYIEKTGSSSDYSYGGNTFAGNTQLINNNTVASGNFNISQDSLSTFGGNLTLKNKGAYGDLVFGSEPGLYAIGGNLTIENIPTGTGNQYLYFSNDNSANITIAGTATIKNIPTSTGSTQNLLFANRGTVTVTGNTAVENTGTGGASKNIYLGNVGDVNFGGDVNILNSSTATTADIRMASNSASTVTISGNTTLNNNGAGTSKRVYFGEYGDITFNGDLAMANNASAAYSEVYLNYRSNSSNTFKGNITLTSNHTSCDGYLFGYDGGSATLAATKTISIPGVDATNFIGGQLFFRNFTQTGSTAQSFDLASTATYIYNRSSNWGGNVTFSAPRIYSRNTTYNGTASLTKTGGIGDDSWPGGNTFVGNATITNAGSKYIAMGNGYADVCQANLTLLNSGSSHIYVAHNSAGNSIAGNLIATNSATGTGDYRLYFANNSSSTLAIGGNVTLTHNGTGKTLRTYFADNGDITIGGNLIVTNSGSGTTSHITFANSSNSSIAITGTSSLTNNNTASASNRMYVGNFGDITFGNNLAIVNDAGSNESEVFLNYRSSSVNAYNGNITVAAHNTSCDGIFFGSAGGQGTLAAGKTISIPGVDATNFTGGQLYFNKFTQTGATAQAIELGVNATYIYNYNSNWGGNVDFKAPRIYTRNSDFDGNAVFTKTGGLQDNSYGGNTFAGNATYTHQGAGRWRIAYSSGNDYNGNATFVKSATGVLHPMYNTSNTLAGNITINANSTVRIGAGGGGRVVFDGTGAQSINTIAATPTPEFRDIQTSNTANDITLNTPLIILSELDLNDGNLITTSTNVVYMNDNSFVSSVSNNAFVDGPLVKIGNDAFTFPVGDNGLYAPVKMSSPSSGSAQFQGQYFNASPQSAGFDTASTSAGLDKVSNNEYWTLNRLASSSNVKAYVTWSSDRSGNIGKGTLCDLRVARWDGSKWINEGNGGTTGNASSGSVVSGTSEDCATSSRVTSWINDYPFTVAIDSNYITWDGTAYDGGSDASGAPTTADAGRILKVYAPGAVASIDAALDKVIVTSAGELTISSGIALTVSGIIDNEGSITVENNGSLIQTSAGADENIGAGTYFVERTGNTSNVSYNIWSSPVKNADITSVFTGANPCDMWIFDGVNQAWTHDFTAGYSTSCSGNAVTFTASDVIAGGDGIMDAARGYFVPGAVISTKQFTGDVNNGDITVGINKTNLGNQPFWNDDDWNLIGNPYPSALSASAFWTENAVNNARITDALYFWDDNGTGTGYNQNADYASWNALGGVNSGNSAVIPAGDIASGQGFWVVANENTNVQINNSMRTGNNDQFFKKEPDANKHLSWIGTTTPSGYNNNILVGYTNTTTDSIDALYDAHKLAGNAHVRFASLIGAEEFAIQGFEALSIGDNKVIPLVLFTDETGDHSFEEYKRENIPAYITIYIRDLVTGITHNLENGAYTVSLTGNQTYSNRFELVFEYTIEIANGGSTSKGSPADTTTIVTNVNTIQAENIYTLTNVENEFILRNENGINGNVNVMDINGKVVWSSQNITNNQVRIPLQYVSAGIYFVHVTNNNQSMYHNKIVKN